MCPSLAGPLTGISVKAHSISCSESGKLPLIGLTGMVPGTDSHSPHLKAGFSKHKKLVIQARWELPGGGGREQKFPTWQEGPAVPRCPSPSQSGLPLCWADKGQLVMLAERWAEGKSQGLGKGQFWGGNDPRVSLSQIQVLTQSLHGSFWKVLQGPSYQSY